MQINVLVVDDSRFYRNRLCDMLAKDPEFRVVGTAENGREAVEKAASPLAAGVVERRGGMLIHGAIIAREYGIACVTGVPDAAALIHTGDEVTVDGYLGIVTVGKRDRANAL